MTRFIVLFIASYVVYYLLKNSLKGMAAGKTHQGRKEKQSDEPVTHFKEIAYVFYSSAKDGDTCDVCKALDGRHLLPNHKMLHNAKPPHPGCKNPNGCRCTLVYVTRDEEDSKTIESLLVKHGGMCDKHVIDKALGRITVKN